MSKQDGCGLSAQRFAPIIPQSEPCGDISSFHLIGRHSNKNSLRHLHNVTSLIIGLFTASGQVSCGNERRLQSIFHTFHIFSGRSIEIYFDEKWPIFAWQPFMIAGNASQTLGNKRKCLGINDGSIYSNVHAGIEYRMMANQSPSGQSTGSAHFPIGAV